MIAFEYFEEEEMLSSLFDYVFGIGISFKIVVDPQS